MELFRKGKAVFLRLWFSSGGDLLKPDTTLKAEQWDVTTLPSQTGMAPGPGVLGTWNLGVSKFSKKQKESLEAISILTDEASQIARTLGNGNLPSRVGGVRQRGRAEEVPLRQADAGELQEPEGTRHHAVLGADSWRMPWPRTSVARRRSRRRAEQAIKDMAAKMRDVQKA